MTETVEFDWLRWQDSPPHACCIPVEVACDGWDHIRLWRPATPLPDDAHGLLWRPCGREMLRLAMEGGIYGSEGDALYGSSPLVVNPADPCGPWPAQFVIRPAQWPDCGPVARLWLVPPCGGLTEVPPTILSDLLAVADGGEPIVMRGLDGAQLRVLAGQVVDMTGGYRA